MSDVGGARSMQEIIRARQSDDFVGRQQQRDDFRANLRCPPDTRKFVFALHGQAGIGKTHLLRQLHGIALEIGALTARTDENETDLVALMAAVSRQIAGQGGETRGFSQRFADYQRRRDEVLADPQAPSAARELLTTSAVRVAFSAVRALPCLGVLADAVTPEEANTWLDQASAFFAAKFRNHADVQLLLSPVDDLAPLLVDDLRRLAQHRQLVLMFDNFERTTEIVEPWLLRLLEGHFGELPTTLVLAIAGQYPLDVNKWGEYAAITVDWRLDPFTDDEARTLLRRKGVSDQPTIEVILELSGRLPLLVATLADGPHTGGAVQDLSGMAVERFLKWEPDAARRSDVLLAALPRVLDEDVLAVLAGPRRAAGLFQWLREFPFVVESHGRLHFQQVVRGPMVRHGRGRSPSRFAELHRALFAHYRNRRLGLGLSERHCWADAEWRRLLFEETYHLLCADSRRSLSSGLRAGADVCLAGAVAARHWLDMLAEAGRDADDPAIAECVRALRGDGEPDPIELRRKIIDRADSTQRSVARTPAVPWSRSDADPTARPAVAGAGGAAGVPGAGFDSGAGAFGPGIGGGAGGLASGLGGAGWSAPGTGGAASAGGAAGRGGALGASSQRGDDEEHQRPSWLADDDDDWFDDMPKAAPPVIGL
ncbi:ATP-binding protein [Saccharopolyspora sp. K220]|uniref:ATP-binding protein n=1 Tax=Saccharopolyspora soli TaxID=2926618 RepID=UPI001F567B3F|nr:ATP-binding protein [Saccharopolyspora soli]MCI2418003.1 ATP-binding protein [Saccharopolyspora soli]